MTVHIERVVTAGILNREGQSLTLENNVWIVGDDAEVLIIDAAHDASVIASVVNGRRVQGILLTHGHEDHINAARDLASLVDAPVHLHPDDSFLWHELYTAPPDAEIQDGNVYTISGIELTTLHTPGHTPGSVCFDVPQLGTVFTGDTLFHGGPGATRWKYSSFPQIIQSINSRLFTLPSDSSVLPGHGQHSTVGVENTRLTQWVNRGCRGPAA